MDKKVIAIAGVIIAIVIAIIAVFALKGDKEKTEIDNSKNMTTNEIISAFYLN